MLLGIVSFVKIGTVEGHTFVMGVNGVAFTYVRESIWHSKSIERHPNICVLCGRVLSLFYKGLSICVVPIACLLLSRWAKVAATAVCCVPVVIAAPLSYFLDCGLLFGAPVAAGSLRRQEVCASFCFGFRVCHRCSQTQGAFTGIRLESSLCVLDPAQSISIVRTDLCTRLVLGLFPW
jgi:hypothetical protein